LSTLHDTALDLHRQGVALIPCRPDKVATVKWSAYQTKLPAHDDLEAWFGFMATPEAGAIVAGLAQCLDIDEKHAPGIFAAYRARADEVGLGPLVDSLVRQRTPSGGRHLVWLCPDPIRNVKLAVTTAGKAAIETRGAGGYFLVSPSPGYVLEAGDLSQIPTITTDDRDALLELAQTFDETPEVVTVTTDTAPPPDGSLSPGDDYNARGDVAGLLRKHDWHTSGKSDTYWTRPGKAKGVSATLGKCGDRCLWVHSTSTNLPSGEKLQPFAVFAHLECGGDFAEAARRLRAMNYGGTREASPEAYYGGPEDWQIIDGSEPEKTRETGAKSEPVRPGEKAWPAPIPASELCAAPPPTPPELVAGMLYETGTLMLSAASKARKTWAMIDFAVSVATGLSWLGHYTSKSTVLYLNLELQGFDMEKRIKKVCQAKAVGVPRNLIVHNLRGIIVSIDQLERRLPDLIRETGAKLVIIDPHYKLSSASGVEENSNDEQAFLLYRIESMVCGNGASVALCHHFSKGNKSEQSAMDRAAGAGAMSRWPDVIMTMTEHKTEHCMTVEYSLRNFAPIPSFVVRQAGAIWVRDGHQDPKNLKPKPAGRPTTNTPEALLEFLVDGMTGGEWQGKSEWGKSTYYEKRAVLEARKVVEKRPNEKGEVTWYRVPVVEGEFQEVQKVQE
jgi:hypothetical protein